VNAKAIGFSVLARGGGFGSAIPGKGQAGEARQHHRPGGGFGDAEWRRREGCELAVSHCLPDVVDAEGLKLAQVDDATAGPLGGILDVAADRERTGDGPGSNGEV
jgi:hypothetical protein